MIQVSVNQLEEVEYLFNQSAKGNHLLFPSEQIKKVFSNPFPIKNEEFDDKKMSEIKSLLETLIYQPTLDKKKKFIANLNEESRDLLIRAYFSLLDTALLQNKDNVH